MVINLVDDIKKGIPQFTIFTTPASWQAGAQWEFKQQITRNLHASRQVMNLSVIHEQSYKCLY
jgi:hypothetical protein